MKAISIIGSPHGKKGNTALLLDEVLKGAQHKDSVDKKMTAFRNRMQWLMEYRK